VELLLCSYIGVVVAAAGKIKLFSFFTFYYIYFDFFNFLFIWRCGGGGG
jgi:hypothetical protein